MIKIVLGLTLSTSLLLLSSAPHLSLPLSGAMDIQVAKQGTLAMAHFDLGLSKSKGFPVFAAAPQTLKLIGEEPPGPPALLALVLHTSSSTTALRSVALGSIIVALFMMAMMIRPYQSNGASAVTCLIAASLPAFHFGATRPVPEVLMMPLLMGLVLLCDRVRRKSRPSFHPLLFLGFFFGAFFGWTFAIIAFLCSAWLYLERRSAPLALSPLLGWFLGASLWLLSIGFFWGFELISSAWSSIDPLFIGDHSGKEDGRWLLARWNAHAQKMLGIAWLGAASLGVLTHFFQKSRESLPSVFWVLTLIGLGHILLYGQEIKHFALHFVVLAPSVAWASTHAILCFSHCLKRWKLHSLPSLIALLVLMPLGYASSHRLHRYRDDQAHSKIQLGQRLKEITAESDSIVTLLSPRDYTLTWSSGRLIRFGLDKPRDLASLEKENLWLLLPKANAQSAPWAGWLRQKENKSPEKIQHLREYTLIRLF